MEECQILSHPNVQLTVATHGPAAGNDAGIRTDVDVESAVGCFWNACRVKINW